jgi:hypothetical protein
MQALKLVPQLASLELTSGRLLTYRYCTFPAYLYARLRIRIRFICGSGSRVSNKLQMWIQGCIFSVSLKSLCYYMITAKKKLYCFFPNVDPDLDLLEND